MKQILHYIAVWDLLLLELCCFSFIEMLEIIVRSFFAPLAKKDDLFSFLSTICPFLWLRSCLAHHPCPAGKKKSFAYLYKKVNKTMTRWQKNVSVGNAKRFLRKHSSPIEWDNSFFSSKGFSLSATAEGPPPSLFHEKVSSSQTIFFPFPSSTQISHTDHYS